KQICLSLDVWKVAGIMADKFHFQSTANSPNRNTIIWFISKNTTVIRNATKWFKGSFGFLIQLVSISDFGNTANQNLSREISIAFKFVIDFIMNLKLVKY